MLVELTNQIASQLSVVLLVNNLTSREAGREDPPAITTGRYTLISNLINDNLMFDNSVIYFGGLIVQMHEYS